MLKYYIMERRSQPRKSYSGELQYGVILEEGTYDRVRQGPAACEDISEIGVRIKTRAQLPHGTAVQLRLSASSAAPLAFLASAVWSAPSPDGEGFRTGFRLTYLGDQTKYREFLKSLPSSN
jgi:hypothetical protein